MSGNYQFGSPEWDDYSDTVKDLVRGQASWLPRAPPGEGSSDVPEGPLPWRSAPPPIRSGVPLLGGAAPEPLHCGGGLGTPLLPAVCGGRGAALQPPRQVQGIVLPLTCRPRAGAAAPEVQAPGALTPAVSSALFPPGRVPAQSLAAGEHGPGLVLWAGTAQGPARHLGDALSVAAWQDLSEHVGRLRTWGSAQGQGGLGCSQHRPCWCGGVLPRARGGLGVLSEQALRRPSR